MSDALFNRAKETLLRHHTLDGEVCSLAIVAGGPRSNVDETRRGCEWTEEDERIKREAEERLREQAEAFKHQMVAYHVMTFGIVGDITVLKGPS